MRRWFGEGRAMLRLRRPLGVFAALGCVVAVVVPVAGASKPVIEPLPAEDFGLPPDICGFAVGVDILANKAKAITFSDGSSMITGELKVKLTNLDDPTSSIVLNIPGPGTFNESGLIARGPWMFFFLPGELGDGSPAILAYTTGRVRIDDSGFHQLAGRRTDLCPRLAST